MCGINALFAYHESARPVDRDELLRTRDQMTRRGPDGQGTWFSSDGRIGFGHRRLSIIDLSERAAQPMLSADGRSVIIFNGEIYNHRELRATLESQGARFVTTSDTEVLLQLYRAKGAQMLSELRGMFAFCIWDAAARTLFLARDPYGIKPLYYADDGRTFRLASRVKALLAGGQVSRTPDPAGVAGFFLRGHVMQPFTTYAAIRALPAGTSMTVDHSGPSDPASYFSIAAVLRDAAEHEPQLSPEERQEIVSDAVAESVRYHLVSDVPVGAFLSGGRDSTAIVAHASAASSTPLRTITIAFDEYKNTNDDEAPYAELVAGSFGTSHVTRRYSRTEFASDLPKILESMDQPTVDAINSYLVSKVTAERGLKVALSGTGGDELFGGYSTFQKIPKLVRRVAPFAGVPLLPRLVRAVHSAIIPAHGQVSPRSAGVLEYGGTYAGAYLLRRGLFMPWELASVMGRDAAAEGLKRLDVMGRIRSVIEPDPSTPFGRVAALESCLFMRDQLLPDIDWASMAHSLEVRVPLVDAFLLRKLAPALVSVPGDRKTLLANSPSRKLPVELLDRPKRGFTVPIRDWLQEETPSEAKRSYGMRLWAKRIYEWTSAA